MQLFCVLLRCNNDGVDLLYCTLNDRKYPTLNFVIVIILKGEKEILNMKYTLGYIIVDY